MPPGLTRQLIQAGLTADDYRAILATDPFASGSSNIDASRYLPTAQSFPYIPPYTVTDPVPTQTYVQQDATLTTASHSIQTQYGVNISVSGGIKTPFSASLKVADSMQWTDVSSNSNSQGSSESATVTVGGPASGYAGPTDILVYWDTIYHSFMFAFPTEAPIAVGTVAGANGQPVANRQIKLEVGSQVLTTFTDQNGKYRFYGPKTGPGNLIVESQRFPVQVNKSAAAALLQLH
jgi:hypothetical protein